MKTETNKTNITSEAWMAWNEPDHYVKAKIKFTYLISQMKFISSQLHGKNEYMNVHAAQCNIFQYGI